MTPEQQCKMLEAAAKVCGAYLLWHERWGCFYDYNKRHESKDFQEWNPLTTPADCAEMCAKLGINTTYWWGSNEVECQCFFVKEFTEFFAYRTAEKDHDNSRLKAWMYAATMVAAKTQGYEE